MAVCGYDRADFRPINPWGYDAPPTCGTGDTGFPAGLRKIVAGNGSCFRGAVQSETPGTSCSETDNRISNWLADDTSAHGDIDHGSGDGLRLAVASRAWRCASHEQIISSLAGIDRGSGNSGR